MKGHTSLDERAKILELSLTTTAQEVSMARRFAVAAAADFGGDEEAQDRVRTLVSELVSNVVLHAATASVVTVRDDRDVITVLVTDGTGTPVRPRRASADHATGRGLAMVEALSADHGSHASDRIHPSGKTVWFTVTKSTAAESTVAQSTVAESTVAESTVDVVAALSRVPPPRAVPSPAATPPVAGPRPRSIVTIPDNPLQPPAGMLRQVLIRGLPVRVWKRAAMHTADLMREFALLQIGRDSGTADSEVPQALLQLVTDLSSRYGGASSAQTAELEDAVDAGLRTFDVTHQVPFAVGDACQTLLDLLEAADDYCAAGQTLLTLVPPPDQRAFRRWYLLEFVRQVRGEPPTAWAGPTD